MIVSIIVGFIGGFCSFNLGYKKGKKDLWDFLARDYIVLPKGSYYIAKGNKGGKKMLNKMLWDVCICLALVGPLLLNGNWLVENISRMAVCFMFLCEILSCLVILLVMMNIKNYGKKVFAKKELEECKPFFRFKVYEPLADLCIACSLAAVGHYILGSIYYISGSIIRGIKYKELEEYEDEENGSKSY